MRAKASQIFEITTVIFLGLAIFLPIIIGSLKDLVFIIDEGGLRQTEQRYIEARDKCLSIRDKNDCGVMSALKDIIL